MSSQRKQKSFEEELGASRRHFLGCLGSASIPRLSALAGGALLSGLQTPRLLGDVGPLTYHERQQRAFAIRRDAALFQRDKPFQPSLDNGDDQLYPNRIASFSKALPHNDLGEVDPGAYSALMQALASGRGSDFEAIPLGGAAKLANPQASYCFPLEGSDGQSIACAAAPAFSSAQAAAEMVEDYWAALTRDVPFSQYGSDPLIAQAVADMNKLSDNRGPKSKGQVTPDVLFRAGTPGDLAGPYISQFLFKTLPFGSGQVVQTYRTTVPGDDYLTAYASWLANQRGAAAGSNVFDSTNRYIRNNRDLGEYTHRDFNYQAYLGAALLLVSYGNPALSPTNYYLTSATQTGSVTLGTHNVYDLVARAAIYALRAVWYQKWLVHRRLRPEVFGARIHNHLTGAASYPIHGDALNSSALKSVFNARGTYLLPIAYPEGSPTHPSYPAAHAATAGACVTVLKALFNESYVIPSPVVSSDDGLSLVNYTGTPLTVGGELNKLASNISMGRNAAGVHYRSDGIEGMQVGETVALAMLRDIATVYHENFSGFRLTRFDGTSVTICPNC